MWVRKNHTRVNFSTQAAGEKGDSAPRSTEVRPRLGLASLPKQQDLDILQISHL